MERAMTEKQMYRAASVFCDTLVRGIQRAKDKETETIVFYAEKARQRLEELEKWCRKTLNCQHKGMRVAEQYLKDSMLTDQCRRANLDLAMTKDLIEGKTREEMVEPSVREIFYEIKAIDKFFGGAKYRNNVLSVETKAVNLWSECGEEIYLGPFQINIDLSRDLSCGLDTFVWITAIDPHPAAENDYVTHPHVNDGVLCFGEGNDIALGAMYQGRLESVFTTINTILHNYNEESPHVALERWFGEENEDERYCQHCGDWYHYVDMAECSKCGEYVCCHCWIRCISCEDIYHPDCLPSCNGGCDSRVCESCEKSCCNCGGTYCESCIKECDICKDEYCESCISECSECGDDICTNCQGKCEDCQSIICNNCSKECNECTDLRLCSDCIDQCEECGETLCKAECLKKCGGCGESTCKNCGHECLLTLNGEQDGIQEANQI
jgi:hypothetical protein